VLRRSVEFAQFTAEEFTERVLARGCKLSMDGRGAWRDNVFVEHLCAA
jgi:putative transposase